MDDVSLMYCVCLRAPRNLLRSLLAEAICALVNAITSWRIAIILDMFGKLLMRIKLDLTAQQNPPADPRDSESLRTYD